MNYKTLTDYEDKKVLINFNNVFDVREIPTGSRIYSVSSTTATSQYTEVKESIDIVEALLIDSKIK